VIFLSAQAIPKRSARRGGCWKLRVPLRPCFLVLILPVAAFAAQSTSTSYILHQSTLSAAGMTSQGTQYRASTSLGQELTVGTSSSPRYVVQSAFLSFVGSGLAPVVLTVTHNPINSENLDLAWTGNNSQYDVYQSVDCTSVFSAFFVTTTDRSYNNISPPAATLVCYNVLASAPGP